MKLFSLNLKFWINENSDHSRVIKPKTNYIKYADSALELSLFMILSMETVGLLLFLFIFPL